MLRFIAYVILIFSLFQFGAEAGNPIVYQDLTQDDGLPQSQWYPSWIKGLPRGVVFALEHELYSGAVHFDGGSVQPFVLDGFSDPQRQANPPTWRALPGDGPYLLYDGHPYFSDGSLEGSYALDSLNADVSFATQIEEGVNPSYMLAGRSKTGGNLTFWKHEPHAGSLSMVAQFSEVGNIAKVVRVGDLLFLWIEKALYSSRGKIWAFDMNSYQGGLRLPPTGDLTMKWMEAAGGAFYVLTPENTLWRIQGMQAAPLPLLLPGQVTGYFVFGSNLFLAWYKQGVYELGVIDAAGHLTYLASGLPGGLLDFVGAVEDRALFKLHASVGSPAYLWATDGTPAGSGQVDAFQASPQVFFHSFGSYGAYAAEGRIMLTDGSPASSSLWAEGGIYTFLGPMEGSLFYYESLASQILSWNGSPNEPVVYAQLDPNHPLKSPFGFPWQDGLFVSYQDLVENTGDYLFLQPDGFLKLSELLPPNDVSTSFSSLHYGDGQVAVVATTGAGQDLELWLDKGPSGALEKMKTGVAAHEVAFVEGQCYFTDASKRQLWSSGTAGQQPYLALDLRVALGETAEIFAMFTHQDTLIFGYGSSLVLYKADGSWTVKDGVRPFTSWEHRGRPTLEYQGKTFFLGLLSSSTSPRLMATDGTLDGTGWVADLFVPQGGFGHTNRAAGSLPDRQPRMQALDGVFIILESYDLFVSDGSAAGTRSIGNLPDPIFAFTILGKNVLALGRNSLWLINFAEGRFLPEKILDHPVNEDPRNHLVSLNHGVAFYCTDDSPLPGQAGRKIWRSDGTASGTYRLPISDFSYNEDPYFVSLGNTLYFSAADRSHNRELWRSDGSLSGTYMAWEGVPGGFGSDPILSIPVGNQLLTCAWTMDYGRELLLFCEIPDVRVAHDAELCGDGSLQAVQVADAGPLASYRWSLRGAAASGPTDERVLSFVPQASVVDLQVEIIQPGGCQAAESIQLGVNDAVPAKPEFIDGPDTFCVGTAGTYTTGIQDHVDAFLWETPPGTLILSGQGTSSIHVWFADQPGEVRVQALNACGISEALVFPVAVEDTDIVVEAGLSQFHCALQSTFLDATPLPAGVNGTWTVESGQGGIFADLHDPLSLFSGRLDEHYRLRWTVQGPCGTQFDEVYVTFYSAPVANGGPDLAVCQTYFTLNAEFPVFGVGHWEFAAGPQEPVDFYPNGQDLQVRVGVPGSYFFNWIVTHGNCSDAVDSVRVDARFPANTLAPVHLIEAGRSSQMEMQSPRTMPGQWQFVDGPSVSLSQISDVQDPQATFTPSGGIGAYTLRYEVDLANCGNETDQTVVYSDISPFVPQKLDLPDPQLWPLSIIAGDFLYFVSSADAGRGVLGVKNLEQDTVSIFPDYSVRQFFAVPELDHGIFFLTEGNCPTLCFLEGQSGAVETLADCGSGGWIRDAVSFQGLLYFVTDLLAGQGWQLWSSDGTEAGTSMLTWLPDSAGAYGDLDLFAGPSSVFIFQSYYGGLWVSDGTEIGTFFHPEILIHKKLGFVGDRLLFEGYLPSNGLGTEIYQAEGHQLSLFQELWPGHTQSQSRVHYQFSFGDQFFIHYRIPFSSSYEVAFSDGFAPFEVLPSFAGMNSLVADSNRILGTRTLSDPYRSELLAWPDPFLPPVKIQVSSDKVSLPWDHVSQSFGPLSLFESDGGNGSSLHYYVTDGQEGGLWIFDQTPAHQQDGYQWVVNDQGQRFVHAQGDLFFTDLTLPYEAGVLSMALSSCIGLSGEVFNNYPGAQQVQWTVRNGRALSSYLGSALRFAADPDERLLVFCTFLDESGLKRWSYAVREASTLPDFSLWQSDDAGLDLDQSGKVTVLDLAQMANTCQH